MSSAIDSSLTNFVNQLDVQQVLYNNVVVSRPSNTSIVRDTDVQTERIRLNFQCDQDVAMHGLLGVSYAQDPYLGSSFGYLGGSTELATSTTFANNS